ncbi:hypothetical protein FHW69_002504 [Luteibacter sp. Sphag1AF]|uniref:hypothetical protein n=1 Tax=Luteibacter sp. Sphag1AF TaxID=2587031 RepID=UPI00161D8941|nr:hypothetical protein [Luteibacter sp. Sphag1AF]MBB3227872.1 hypothetical protein [Luteibacter sp. Sphag1AF]
MVLAANKAQKRARPFAAWRMVTWLVMLLAGVGFILNVRSVMMVGNMMEGLANVPGTPDPRVALAWAVGYAVFAFIVIVMCLAALRWRPWARNGMRVVSAVLLVWAAVTAGLAFRQCFELTALMTGGTLPPEAIAAVGYARAIILTSGILKAISVPLLGWLIWQLGRAPVRAQFEMTSG